MNKGQLEQAGSFRAENLRQLGSVWEPAERTCRRKAGWEYIHHPFHYDLHPGQGIVLVAGVVAVSGHFIAQ